MRTAVIALLAIAMGCEDDDGGEQPPVTPPVEPLSSVGLQLVAEGFTSPILLLEAPDDTGRLYVVDQVGVIRVIDANGQLLDAPFLDLRSNIVGLMPDYDERGLLGLAFHPDYANNRRIYVHYSTWRRSDEFDHTDAISEFTVFAEGDAVDIGSERRLLEIDHPQFNHNGGMLAFGPDGYLYISIGDGGGANDVGDGHAAQGNAQNLETLLGKILRINVDTTGMYGIPSDNPFVGIDGRDEIYAYGFRNPYRFSFDMAGDRRLFVGDAGQNRWEEVSIVNRGANYGWNIREGAHCFDPNMADVEPASCPDVGANGEPLVAPILEYQNANVEGGVGLVVIGGFVYRGSAVPELDGEYIFGDFSADFETPSGLLFAARENTDGSWEMRKLEIASGALGEFVRGFGQDLEGDVYFLTANTAMPTGTGGRVYRIVSKDFVEPPPVDTQLAAQLAEGAVQFAENCARCHGDAGMGTAIAPPLVGPGALPLDPPPGAQVRSIQFHTAADVFAFASEFMPADMPGTLSDQTYLNIIAFAADQNGIELTEAVTLENAGEVVINQPQ